MDPSSQLSPSIRSRETAARPQVSRGCGMVFFAIMILVAAGWGSGLGAFVFLLEQAQSKIEALESFRPKVGSRIYAQKGDMLGEYTFEAQDLVNLSEIPLTLQKAFLASEDHLFYEHKGVRPIAAISAIRDTLQTGRRLRGFSTITMQLVRNTEEATQVSRERTYSRKFQESIVALQLEREFTKDEILELYLNLVFLGGSAKGVEAASWQYFGKSCRDLNLAECAVLPGLAPSPNAYRPDRHPEAATRRRDTVLMLMRDRGFITEAAYEDAVQQDVTASLISDEARVAAKSAGEGYWGPNEFFAWYFVEEARKRMMEADFDRQVTFDELYGGGFEIYTTLDMDLQRAAEDTLLTALDEFDAKRREQLEKSGRLNEFLPVSGALVCIDNRDGHEGKVRALVGGRDSDSQKFNNATQAERQAGSSVKPFVWAAALDMGRTTGLTAAHRIVDEPFARMGGDNKLWQPKNFDGKFHGPITLRSALERSVNIVSIKLVDRPEVGVPVLRSYLKSVGFEKEINVQGLTVALGSHEVIPIEQCVAYSTIARGGRYAPASFVEKILDRDGNTIYQSKVQTQQRIREDLAYVMTHLLEGVATRGTGARTRTFDRPRGGKTGTTNESRDVWFCGFTPQYTCIVWVGYKDNRPLGRGANYTGGRLAAPIWANFMIQAHQGLPVLKFEKPDSVKSYGVDRSTGRLGGSFPEMFLEGTAPPTELPVYMEKSTNEALMEQELLGIAPSADAMAEPITDTVKSSDGSQVVAPEPVTVDSTPETETPKTTPKKRPPKRRFRDWFRRN